MSYPSDDFDVPGLKLTLNYSMSEKMQDGIGVSVPGEGVSRIV
jgi:hypothetical protein